MKSPLRRLVTTLAIFLLVGPSAVPGQFGAELGLAISGDFLSEHVQRGLERADETAHGRVAWRGESWRAAWDAYLPLRSAAPAEWRVEGGWGSDPAKKVSVEALARWSHFTRARSGMAEDTIEFGVEAKWLLPREVLVGAAAFHDVTLEATTAEGSVAYSLPLTKLGAYLDLRAWMGWSDARNWQPNAPGPRVAGGYGYLGAEATVPYRVGEVTSVVAGVSYSESWNAREEGSVQPRGGRRNLTWRIGVTFEF